MKKGGEFNIIFIKILLIFQLQPKVCDKKASGSATLAVYDANADIIWSSCLCSPCVQNTSYVKWNGFKILPNV